MNSSAWLNKFDVRGGSLSNYTDGGGCAAGYRQAMTAKRKYGGYIRGTYHHRDAGTPPWSACYISLDNPEHASYSKANDDTDVQNSDTAAATLTWWCLEDDGFPYSDCRAKVWDVLKDPNSPSKESMELGTEKRYASNTTEAVCYGGQGPTDCHLSWTPNPYLPSMCSATLLSLSSIYDHGQVAADGNVDGREACRLAFFV